MRPSQMLPFFTQTKKYGTRKKWHKFCYLDMVETLSSFSVLKEHTSACGGAFSHRDPAPPTRIHIET